MIYRRFGRTELAMPVATCGGMRYQQAWKDLSWDEIEPASQANVQACVEHALAAGITHIETARGYGSSELQLGRVLPSLPRDAFLLQTKVGPAQSADDFIATFNASMERLRLDYVDLLAIHGVNNQELLDLSLQPGGSLDACEQLKREGRCRHIGFSTHAPTQVVVDGCATGRFDYVNLHYYWSDQYNRRALEAAAAQDMGVFIISPNDKGGKLYAPSDKLVELCAPLSPMVFNDLWCWTDERIHTLSIGAARPSDLDPAIEAADLLPQVDDLLPPILARLRQAAVDALGERWMDGWWQGLPETDDVPGTINIYQMLRLYTLAKAYDLTTFARERHGMFANGGHWVYGNTIDQLDLDEVLPLLQASPVADLLPEALADAKELLSGEARQRLSQGG